MQAKVANTDQILIAAYTIYKDIPLPENDKVLHDLIRDMWLVDASGIEEAFDSNSLADYMRVNPKFVADVCVKLMCGSTGAVRQYCKKCGRYEEFKRSEVATKQFLCAKCKCTEAKPSVALLSSLTINKYW